MVSYIVYLVICSPHHPIFLKLILPDICSSGLLILLLYSVPVTVYLTCWVYPRGFPHLDSYQRSQDYSHLSWADTDSASPENQPPHRKNCVPRQAWSPSAPTQFGLCVQSCEGPGLASWCQTSTSERELTLLRSL